MPVLPKFMTSSVHAGVSADPQTGAIMTPIYQTSTFVQSSPGEHLGWDYSRAGNPTRDALEAAYAELEGAKYGLAFASGLAAEQAIIQGLVKPGDRVIVSHDVYGGTGRLFRRILAPYGIHFEFLDLTKDDVVASAFSKPFKLVWVETPSNPMMEIVSIQKLGALAKKQNAVLVVDNTFASPVFQNPLEHGADIVLHSTTKYIGGHSDIIGGAVMTSRADLWEPIKFIQFAGGAVPGPLECFMLLRSLKTLAVRMKQHEENAWQVAEFLAKHSDVEQVYFAGFATGPVKAIVEQQMRGQSGMISLRLKGDYSRVLRFLEKLKLFALAESLGGVESLINHPERMTHASVPPEMRKILGISENLLRLSVGIESASDLVEDLKQALKLA